MQLLYGELQEGKRRVWGSVQKKAISVWRQSWK